MFIFKWLSKAWGPLLTIFGLLGLSCAIIAVSLTAANLTTSGGYTAAQHAAYIIITTIFATLFTTIVRSYTRKLFLMKIDVALAHGANLEQLNTWWRSVLGLASVVERTRNLHVALAYLCTGLITTVIVASFSPSTTTRSYSYNPAISYGPGLCGEALTPSQVGAIQGYPYYWTNSNGSAFVIQSNTGYCPTREAVTLASDINTNNPLDFAYADEGVAVHVTAIGTPFSVYSTDQLTAPEFNGLFNQYASNVLSTTQCVPIMTQNPISCRPGGNVTVFNQNGLTVLNIVSSDGRCNANEPYLVKLISTNQGFAINVFCPQGDVGQGTIVMGGTAAYGDILAKSFREVTFGNSGNLTTFAVTCSVDTRNVFSYHQVTLELQSQTNSTSSYTRTLVGGEVCSPSPGASSAITEYLYGVSAAALWQLFIQNAGLDGFPDTITKLTLGDTTGRGPPWAFNNSQNALEDILGLNAAIVSSRAPRNASRVQVEGSVIVSATRVGSGSPFAIAYVLPLILAALILIYLLCTVKFMDDTSCRTSNLYDLLMFRGLDNFELDLSRPGEGPWEKRSVFQLGSKPTQSYVTDIGVERIRPYDGT
jgi:hypothetical protein